MFNHTGLNNTSFDYNPASQITSRVVTNINYQTALPQVGVVSFTPNELNQYDSVNWQPLSYDLNGNTTAHDGWTYQYNAHNRLTSASKTGTNLSLAYDATGRLNSSTLNGSKTSFLYDGDELVAEYNASGALLNRYIHGAGTDDPLVWYTGTGTSNKRYLLADERGSIVSETNATGGVVTTHRYGPYGEPVNQSASRFRYTGQILIPGTELYHYKARVYHPKLGRFMQTDPIGYQDGMNWYAYVGNDPVNATDPTGKFGLVGALIGAAVETGAQLLSNGGNISELDYSDIGIAAAVGFVTGGVGGRLATSAAKGTISVSSAVTTTASVGGTVSGVGAVAAGELNGKSATASEVGAAIVGGTLGAGAGAKIATGFAKTLEKGFGRLNSAITSTTRSGMIGDTVETGTTALQRTGEVAAEAASNAGQKTYKKLNQ